MSLNEESITTIIYKSLIQELQEEETERLHNWLTVSQKREDWYDRLLNDPDTGFRLAQQSPERLQHLQEELYQKILQRSGIERELPIQAAPISKIYYKRWWLAAASILVIFGVAIYYLNQRSIATSDIEAEAFIPINPGKNGAILTMANGQQVNLDAWEENTVNLRDGSVAYMDNGVLTYFGTSNTPDDTAKNILTTPKGRQFQIILSDGTKVWLNSGSSITFPKIFASDHRIVQVKGEAYFEVAKNPEAPFVVNINNRMQVKVLGTHFNISAYEDEKEIRTTLLEGKVHIASVANDKGSDIILKPGEQVRLAASHGSDHALFSAKIVRLGDPEQAIAWKAGLFNFEETSLEEIMRQLARWYDIQIRYEDGIPDNLSFRGELTRNVPLHDLLVALKKMGLKYRLEDKTLIIIN